MTKSCALVLLTGGKGNGRLRGTFYEADLWDAYFKARANYYIGREDDEPAAEHFPYPEAVDGREDVADRSFAALAHAVTISDAEPRHKSAKKN